MHTCPQCGAAYVSPGDSCDARWQRLLALDHSRRAPWGPLHALSFATFTLQHADGVAPATIARCRDLLDRVIRRGESLPHVVSEYRERGPGAHTPEAVVSAPPRHFAVTIAELGDFAAPDFESGLRRWAHATLEAWSAASPTTPQRAE